LSLVGGAYALYLVYQGLPVLMKNPAERTLPFFAVSAVIGILGSIFIGMACSVFLPSPQVDASAITAPAPGNGPASDTTVTVQSPDGETKVVAESLQDMARRLEAMAAAQEKAQQQPGGATAPVVPASQ